MSNNNININEMSIHNSKDIEESAVVSPSISSIQTYGYQQENCTCVLHQISLVGEVYHKHWKLTMLWQYLGHKALDNARVTDNTNGSEDTAGCGVI